MANDRYIVNGEHQADRLRDLLDAFIDKFVLCASCKNPETELVITGKGKHENVHRDCKACGAHTDIDMRHKLTTFILKNPPKKDKKAGKKGMTAQANVGGPVVYEETAANGGGDEDSPNGTPAPGDADAALAKATKDLDVDDDEEDANSPYALLGVWLEENRSVSDADILAKMKELEIAGKYKALVPIGEKLFTATEAPKQAVERAALLSGVSISCYNNNLTKSTY
jgi:translation initiation factor 5